MNVRFGGFYLWALCIFMYAAACQIDDEGYNVHFQPFTNDFARNSGYNLLQPSQTFILPEILTEISGLATISDSVLACVQDEMGSIFLYHLQERRIINRFRFGGTGDFEGIEIIEDQAYILRSNGRITRYRLTDQTTTILTTPLKGGNNAEGLAFDLENNRLLIALKGKAGLNGKSMKGRAIYGYHLTRGFIPEPVFLITSKALESWNDKQTHPLKLTKRKKAFMLSGLAVHPITSELYLIANVGKLLLVLSPQGQIKHCVPLSPRVFRQPEGICFTTAGDLVIANEGQHGSGKIQVFKRTEGLRD